MVNADEYLLRLYRYIELNPVRAGLVEDPAEYDWSSYRCNALGLQSDLLTPHPIYLELAKRNKTRQKRYREFCRSELESKLLEDIRHSANKGLALGDERFIEELENLSQKKIRPGKRGRPVGWRKDGGGT